MLLKKSMAWGPTKMLESGLICPPQILTWMSFLVIESFHSSLARGIPAVETFMSFLLPRCSTIARQVDPDSRTTISASFILFTASEAIPDFSFLCIFTCSENTGSGSIVPL